MDAQPSDSRAVPPGHDTGSMRRLRIALWLLTLALTALVVVAAIAQLQRQQQHVLRDRNAAFGAADRFVELAIRARLMLSVDPARLGEPGVIAQGLFGRTDEAGWQGPVRIRWQRLPGDPGDLLLEIDGVPRTTCAWFAARLLQRAGETEARGLRVNDVIYMPQSTRRTIDVGAFDRLVCQPRNVVALIIGLPVPQMPQMPGERSV